MAAACIQVKQAGISEAENDIKSMILTFDAIDNVGLVMVPMKMFIARPTAICDAFEYRSREIAHNKNLVNVFMETDTIQSSKLGKMDKLTQTWTVQCTSKEDLEDIIDRLSKRTTVLSLTLHRHILTGEDIDIPFVVFITPSSRGMTSLIKQLHEVMTTLPDNKRYAIELDFGPAVEQWAVGTMGQDMTCIGGRFGVTSGDLFNPAFKWNVTAGLLPILPIHLVAGLAYRASRKVKYFEKTIQPDEIVAISGSRSREIDEQKETLADLIRIAVSLSIEKCTRCGFLLSSEDTSTQTCSCPYDGNDVRNVRNANIATTSFTQSLDKEDSELDDETKLKIADFHRMTPVDQIVLDDRKQSFGGLSCFDLEVVDESKPQEAQ
ncbi:uncharacterized protein LOC126831116 [Patella vulgata]|uniref:uncharacterized protein LOC126831116 n=1 Tax=Patella vulgata TaxID=6465 RepID=UPI0021807138|nr:uncharacterized protein LOC126831116 [Patella vulgata]